MNRWALPLAIFLLVIAAALLLGWLWTSSSTEQRDGTSSPTPAISLHPTGTATPTVSAPATQQVQAQAIRGAASAYTFTSVMPAPWQAESVTATEALNLYDPKAQGESTLEQSQIFIRFFSANDFLTLSTVTIHDQEELVLNGRPAVRYDIEKKSSVPIFANQPSWRSERHIVTDIRVNDANPSIFYVIAKNPSLDQAVYDQFLNDLEVTSPAQATTTSLTPPVAQWQDRITKKPFGIHITPATSPVQPERFSGYHTGIDIEYEDVSGDVPVVAITDGTVVASRRVSGYGGMVAVRHEVAGEPVVAIYGHLDPTRLIASGTTVSAGDRVGFLGAGGTDETDGERKHLHLAIHKGTVVDLRGYVDSQSALSTWYDPAELLIS